MKHTKIVATISDIRCDVEFIEKVHKAGMNVARMNTAHMDFDGIERIINNCRQVSENIAVLLDTKGPEVRTAKNASGKAIPVTAGQSFKLTGKNPEDKMNDEETIYVSYDGFTDDVKVGSNVIIDDGE